LLEVIFTVGLAELEIGIAFFAGQEGDGECRSDRAEWWKMELTLFEERRSWRTTQRGDCEVLATLLRRKAGDTTGWRP
jgi:hypothetical protein